MTAESTINPVKEKGAVSSMTARLSIVGILIYHALLFTTIFLRPDIDVRWHTISEYAIGWPPRFLFLSYMVWVITVAWLAIKVKHKNI